MEKDYTINRPNWLGSEVGLVVKTTTIPATHEKAVVENGRLIVKSGSVITEPLLGFAFGDYDVTDGDVIGAVMVGGYYIDSKLPDSVAEAKEDLDVLGLHAFDEGTVVRPDFGGAPTLIKLTIGTVSNVSGSLSWSAVDHAVKYSVYSASAQDGKYSFVADVNAAAYTATASGYYKVKAVGDGLVYADSDLSSAVQVTIS